MSGRLVILPKKTYCPWKPENVERVLCDERFDRERREKEEELLREQESRVRLRALKRGQEKDKHFHLFEQEERDTNQLARIDASEEIVPDTLGDVTRKRPFYMQSEQETRNDMTGLTIKEEKRKAALDPMQTFQKVYSSSNQIIITQDHCSDLLNQQPQKKKEEKGKRKRRQGDSMAELRRRRNEREENEAQRAAILTQSNQATKSNRYQNQYNPRLSRR
jgi:hypothetical protein